VGGNSRIRAALATVKLRNGRYAILRTCWKNTWARRVGGAFVVVAASALSEDDETLLPIRSRIGEKSVGLPVRRDKKRLVGGGFRADPEDLEGDVFCGERTGRDGLSGCGEEFSKVAIGEIIVSNESVEELLESRLGGLPPTKRVVHEKPSFGWPSDSEVSSDIVEMASESWRMLERMPVIGPETGPSIPSTR